MDDHGEEHPRRELSFEEGEDEGVEAREDPLAKFRRRVGELRRALADGDWDVSGVGAERPSPIVDRTGLRCERGRVRSRGGRGLGRAFVVRLRRSVDGPRVRASSAIGCGSFGLLHKVSLPSCILSTDGVNLCRRGDRGIGEDGGGERTGALPGGRMAEGRSWVPLGRVGVLTGGPLDWHNPRHRRPVALRVLGARHRRRALVRRSQGRLLGGLDEADGWSPAGNEVGDEVRRSGRDGRGDRKGEG